MAFNSLHPGNMNLSSVLPHATMGDIVDPTAQVRATRDARDYAQQNKDDATRDKVLEQMLKDPKNAQYYSQAFNIPITPELAALLKNPEQAARLADASKIADGMGIKDPTAKQAFVQTYMQTGNLAEAGKAVEGMDVRAPMTTYQEAMVGVNQGKNDILSGKNNILLAKAQNGGGSTARIPEGFTQAVATSLDTARGVKYTDNTHTRLMEGSPQPLDPSTVMAIANRAATLTQKNKNPVASIKQAYDEMGGDAGLQDGSPSPMHSQSTDEPVKYKTFPTTSVTSDNPLGNTAGIQTLDQLLAGTAGVAPGTPNPSADPAATQAAPDAADAPDDDSPSASDLASPDGTSWDDGLASDMATQLMSGIQTPGAAGAPTAPITAAPAAPAAAPPMPSSPTPAAPAPAAPKSTLTRVRVQTPDGRTGTIDSTHVDSLVKAGGRVLQ